MHSNGQQRQQRTVKDGDKGKGYLVYSRRLLIITDDDVVVDCKGLSLLVTN